MKKTGDIFSGLGEESTGNIDEKDDLDDDSGNCLNSSDVRSNNVEEALDGVKLMPLCGDLKSLLIKKKYKNMFDHVYLSQQTAHNLEQSTFKSILKSGGTVSVESGKYVFPLGTDSQQKIMDDKIVGMAATQELTPRILSRGENKSSSKDGSVNGDILCFQI